MALTGADAVYAADAGTFLLSGLCLAFIRLAPAAGAKERSTVMLDLHHGCTEFRSA